jgi:hypothetical protein
VPSKSLSIFFPEKKKDGVFSPPSWKVKGLLKIYPSDKKARLQKLQPAIAGVCSTGTSTVPQKLLSDTGIFSIQPAIQLTKQDKQIRRVSASHSQHSSRMQKKKELVRTLEQSMAWHGLPQVISYWWRAAPPGSVCLLCTLLLELQVHVQDMLPFHLKSACAMVASCTGWVTPPPLPETLKRRTKGYDKLPLLMGTTMIMIPISDY